MKLESRAHRSPTRRHARPQVADHLKVLKAAPEEHFSSVQVAARAIKMALKFNMTNAATFFAELDKDQSGDISTAELVNGLRDLGLPAFSQAQCDSCCRHLALIWDAPIQGELESLAAALGAKNDRFTYTNFRHFLGENALRQHEVCCTKLSPPPVIYRLLARPIARRPQQHSALLTTVNNPSNTNVTTEPHTCPTNATHANSPRTEYQEASHHLAITNFIPITLPRPQHPPTCRAPHITHTKTPTYITSLTSHITQAVRIGCGLSLSGHLPPRR